MLYPCWRRLYYVLGFIIPYCATTPGSLTLFLDEECSNQDMINSPAQQLEAYECRVTTGLIGIAIDTYPSCSSGAPILIVYQDTSCTKPVDDDNITQNNDCFSVGLNGISAVKVFYATAAATTSTSIEPTATANLSAAATPSPLPKIHPAVVVAVTQALD